MDPSQTGGSEEMGVKVGAVGGERPCKSDRTPWNDGSRGVSWHEGGSGGRARLLTLRSGKEQFSINDKA